VSCTVTPNGRYLEDVGRRVCDDDDRRDAA
jgi:hypothetical protein